MSDLTRKADRGALRLDFNRRLMLQFRGSTIEKVHSRVEQEQWR
jgi:hypothetical protein